MHELNLTHHDMDYYDQFARIPKGPPKTIPYEERKKRWGDQCWLFVRDNKGGSATVPTKAYPTDSQRNLEKPAPPVHPKQPSASSSSSSWDTNAEWYKSWNNSSTWHEKRRW